MLTSEQKKAIAEDYKNGMKVGDILIKYGCSSHEITKSINEFGVPSRRPYQQRKKRSAVKKCIICKRTIELKGARFCPFCGADIRSEVEILDERLNKLFSMCTLLPSNMADEAQETIKAVSAYLKKEV